MIKTLKKQIENTYSQYKKELGQEDYEFLIEKLSNDSILKTEELFLDEYYTEEDDYTANIYLVILQCLLVNYNYNYQMAFQKIQDYARKNEKALISTGKYFEILQASDQEDEDLLIRILFDLSYELIDEIENIKMILEIRKTSKILKEDTENKINNLLYRLNKEV